MAYQPPQPPPNPSAQMAQQRQQLFNQQREQATQQVNAQEQQNNDAIARRMTALGQGAGSGAAMGLQRQAALDAQNQRQQAVNAVNANEAQANLASAEAQAGRDLQESQFGRTMGEQGRMFDVEQGNKLRQLDMAEQQAKLEQEAQWFNERMAELQSGQQVDLNISRGHFQTPEEYNAFLRRLTDLSQTRAAEVARNQAAAAEAQPKFDPNVPRDRFGNPMVRR